MYPYKVAASLAFLSAVCLPLFATAGAAESFDTFIARFGQHGPLARSNLPTCFTYRKPLDVSVKDCIAAVSLVAPHPLARAQRAVVHATILTLRNRPHDARTVLAEQTHLIATSFELSHFAARLMQSGYSRNDRAPLIAFYERMITTAESLAPKNADILATKGYGHFMMTRLSEAKSTFDRALAIAPNQVFSLTYRAKTHQYLGRTHLTLRDLNQAVAAAPHNIAPRQLRGRFNMMMGNLETAVEDFDIIVRKTSHHQEALAGRATALHLLGRLRDALADFDRLLNQDKSRPMYAMNVQDRAVLLLKRSMVHRALFDHQSAARDMLSALKIGGRQNVLRVQIFLRRNGHPKISLSGSVSPDLEDAVARCFRSDLCADGIGHAL